MLKQLFLVHADRKSSPLLKLFQLISVLFSCAVSGFLHEEFSAMPIRAIITFMLFLMRMFLLILIVLIRIKIPDKS